MTILLQILTWSALCGFLLFAAHRTHLLLLFRKHRSDRREPGESEKLPFVTIQLPIYNERTVAERLIARVTEIRYPGDRLEIQVLDDSTDETVDLVGKAVAEARKRGIEIRHLRRTNRDGYKAGALAFGTERAKGDFLAVFDADFLPPADFLLRLVPYFADPDVGMVQARWTFLNEDESSLTRAQAVLLRAHFEIEHFARCRSGRFFNFNGTAGIWRKSAILDAGGWQGDTLTEDLDLSYRAQMRGWRFVYAGEVECPSELPATMRAFKAQQFRWLKGMAQVSRKLLPDLVRSPLPARVKCEAVFHLLSGTAYLFAFGAFLTLLPAILLIPGSDRVWSAYLASFVVTFLVAFLFHRAAERSSWIRFLGTFLSVIVLAAGLALTAARAILEGFFGVTSPFARTPKAGDGTIRGYAIPVDPMVALECLCAGYAAAILWLSHGSAFRIWPAIFLIGWCRSILGQWPATGFRLGQADRDLPVDRCRQVQAAATPR